MFWMKSFVLCLSSIYSLRSFRDNSIFRTREQLWNYKKTWCIWKCIFIFKMSWWKIKCICILTSHIFPQKKKKTFINNDSDFMLWYCDVKEILQNLQHILHLLLYCPWNIRCPISSHNYYHNKIRVVCLNELRL